MSTIEFLFRFGINRTYGINLDTNLNTKKEINQFIKNLKRIKNDQQKIYYLQETIFKAFWVHQELSEFIKNMDINLNEVLNKKSNYFCYLEFKNKIAFLYSTALQFYFDELLIQHKNSPEIYLQSFKQMFEMVLNSDRIDRNDYFF